MVKRTFDIVFSLLGLVVVFPLMAIISILIKAEDGGPITYRAIRVGKDGRLFRLLKFRSMVVNADQIGAKSTADGDPRITKIGEFLRKTKLDELPQLINVLKGDMSFVGPRPEVKYFTDMFSVDEKKILRVRPGITDLASIVFSDEGAILHGAADPDLAYMEIIRPKKLLLQMYYIKNQSFLLDMSVLFKTIQAVVLRKSFRPSDFLGQ